MDKWTEFATALGVPGLVAVVVGFLVKWIFELRQKQALERAQLEHQKQIASREHIQTERMQTLNELEALIERLTQDNETLRSERDKERGRNEAYLETIEDQRGQIEDLRAKLNARHRELGELAGFSSAQNVAVPKSKL